MHPFWGYQNGEKRNAHTFEAHQVEQLLPEDEALRQINRNLMYQVNCSNFEVVKNATAKPGNTVSGNRARYILEDRRYDVRRFNFNSYLESAVKDNYEWAPSGEIDPSDHQGKAYIAFRYEGSSGGNTSTFQLDNISVVR